MRRFLLSLPFLLLFLAPVANAGRDDDSDSGNNEAGVDRRCEAKMDRAAGRYAKCLLKAKARAARDQDQDVQETRETEAECREDFDGAVSDAQARHQEENCTPLITQIERRTASYANAVALEAAGVTRSRPSPTPPEAATEPPSWLMVQDSGSVSFDFDGSTDPGCPTESFWSGTMTMRDADPETLWFSDRPDRLAFTQTTDEFVTGFGETFTESTGGDPNAVLNWEDSADDAEKHAVLELRYLQGTSPQYDGDARVLTYSVCGLRLDDPGTLQPLPESEQVKPPEIINSIGKTTLFIDPSPSPTDPPYNCFVGAFCAQQAASTSFYGMNALGNTNVYAGHTRGTEPALGAGCNTGQGATNWNDGAAYYDTVETRDVPDRWIDSLWPYDPSGSIPRCYSFSP